MTMTLHRRLARGALAVSTLVLLTACGGLPQTAAPADVAGCPGDAEVAEQARRYLAKEPVPNPSVPTLEAGACGARKYVAALQPALGSVVGYKAGLTTAAVQQRFGISSPLRGTLLQKMLLSNGAHVPAAFGARPFMEPDLAVVVGSSAIHDAKTPLEVLSSLRSVVPFIELPDLTVADPSKITGPSLLALNVGARLGVLGTPVPVRADAAFADALRDMTVRTLDPSGKELSKAPGAAILGHPLNAVIWLAADLKKAGITLKPGDVLSLGAYGNLQTPAGASLTVVYEGLPGNPTVSVNIR